ncbi:DUF262 domain-containing protein [Variovorax sp. M-6]
METAWRMHRLQAALVIPSYQRPYVWSGEDVEKLLQNIIDAHRDRAPHYYIGTVLTAVGAPRLQGSAGVTYELIDGQQRMTTLMLFALAFGKLAPHSAVAQFAVLDKLPRLTFAIRAHVQALFGHWIGLEDHAHPGEQAVRGDPYLTHLAGAFKTVNDRLDELRQEKGQARLDDLGRFLFEKVKWVNNVMPRGTDLNRQFTTMNTSGVQLAQSDILKSQLLKKIARHKARYDAMWQACENMENYFERNVRQLFPAANWSVLEYADLARFSSERFPLPGDDQGLAEQRLSIAQLAAEAPGRSGAEMELRNEQADTEEIYCDSIIGFPLLLMHAFRIFGHRRSAGDISVRLSDARLNECFEDFISKATEEDAIGFIECLWQVRHQFDCWVVKWVGSAESTERQLLLSSVSRSQSRGVYRLNRGLPQAVSDLTQLQSVSYFTRERGAQYWLTPFLGALVDRPLEHRADVERLLERIDNQLSLTRATQKEASFALLSGDCGSLDDIRQVCGRLQESLGTGFGHYWFQKLEYVLWRRRSELACFLPDKLASYRIISRNSVEHVHPQREEYGRTLAPEVLHSFGNLVLLSPGENSSYSNQSVDKKWADFNSKPRYDALKLAHIFHTKGDGEWDKTAIGRHQTDMLRMLERHYREGQK